MRHLRTYALALLMSTSVGTISACSVWDMIKPSGGISAEVVVGDKVQTVQTEIGQTVNTADTITIQNDNVDYVTIGLLMTSVATGVVGWMLPVPNFLRRKEKR